MLLRSANFYKINISILVLIFSLNYLIDGFNNLHKNQLNLKDKIIGLQKDQIDKFITVPINKDIEIYEESEESEESEEPVKQTPTDSDDEIFAKFKNTEKIKEIIQEENQVINKFRYKGKLVDILEFKQKINKEEPKNVSFSSWKGIF